MGSPCPTNLTLGSDITTSTTIAKSTITDIRASIEAEFTRRSSQYGNYYFPKDNMGGNNPTLEGWNYGYMWGGPWTGGHPGQSAGNCTHHVAMGSPAIPTCNDVAISDPITTKEINELWSGFRGSRRHDNWGLYCPTDNAGYGNNNPPVAHQNIGPDYGSGASGSNQGADSGQRISRGVTAVEAAADPSYTGQWPFHWGIRRLVEELDEYKIACLCDCDYCTCDCNACNCDCAYCTCDCNQCGADNPSNQGVPYTWGYCPWHYSWRTRTYTDGGYMTCGDFTVSDNTVTEIPPTCTCDCAYCTCDCAYCTCDCNYCTCNCNFCTCNCNAGK